MSKSIPTQQPASNPHLTDLADLADQLRDVAEALLEFCRPPEHDDSGEPEPWPESAGDADDDLSSEIRSYEIPYYVLRDEQELLEATDSHDVLEAINKVYAHIHCVSTLMRNFNMEGDVCGVQINELGELLTPSLKWLEQLCLMHAGVRVVQRKKKE